ncbi:helix-turn-helix transcriptional regulator [Amycolatopsis rhabdoformis]|uniref:Helix-turn-helix transcriptional regulator n=1 Tax=Amycolatopsis rhabdoformis TaxID=1448059 RepID=A0ABZ1IDX3_9PSEU|nr:helix-turn-helix transcriptional regulator [Amycolatopsis rhabdoformis]WSE32670.1 helix-turn-helix transcriptional regulator [Amycolatopsis rhabdoformis]
MVIDEPVDGQARTGALAGLLLALQSALDVREVQAQYLDAVTGLVAATAYGFSRFGPRLTPLTVLTRRAPDGLVPDYHHLGAGRDPVLAAAVTAASPVDNASLMSRTAWQEQSLCGVLGGHGLYHSMVVPLLHETRVLGALYLARTAAERPFTTRDRLAMASAKQHVEAALRRAVRHEDLEQRTAQLTWSLDELDVPVFVTTVDGEILFENNELARLRRLHHRAGPRLAELLSRNLLRLADGTHRVAASSGPFAAGRARREPDLLLTVRSTLARRGGTVVSVAFVRRKDAPAPVERAPLSAREREIVAWVAEGLTNRQIAALAVVSENTVRQHLKRVFAKLDVHSRAQLIQAVWQGGRED